MEFERRKDWRGLLDFAFYSSTCFAQINWATTFSRLGRFRREAKSIPSDSRFRSYG